MRGEALLVDPTGLSLISDIDDTVKITEVLDRKALLRNTLLKDFRAAPGMAELFQRFAREGTSVHFVSSSPWQLYPALDSFLEQEGLPKRLH